MTLHGVSLKSNSHLFYIHGVMFQASGKFHPFSIEFACIPLCHICTLGDSVEVLVKRFGDQIH